MASTKVHTAPTIVTSPPPPFSADDLYTDDNAFELGPVTPTTTAGSPPPYEDATGSHSLGDGSPSAADAAVNAAAPPLSDAGAFAPTLHLQVQTHGKALLGFPLPTRPDPIPVYGVNPATGDVDPVPLYVSLRLTRNSGNCYLVRGDDATETPLCATTYRFGPGRSPVVSLVLGASDPFAAVGLVPVPSGSSSSAAAAQTIDPDLPSFEVNSPSLLSRAVTLKTHIGTLNWRYAARSERRAHDADSLLVLERVHAVALAGGRREERRVRVAHFIRNDRYRSPGTGRSTAGNGGRLEVDVPALCGGIVDAKIDRDEAMLIVVASCLCMLKKEVDRRRMHQIMVLSGAASGGGP